MKTNDGNVKYEYEVVNFRFEGRRYKVRGKTKEEAIEKKNLKLTELEAGRAAYNASRKNITFKSYSEKWATTYNKGIAVAGRKDIQTRLDKYILPHIGHLRMKDITRSDLVALFEDMEGMSRDRINKVRQTLRKILEAAYDDGYLPKVPNLKMVDMPSCKEAVSRRAVMPYERLLTHQVAKYHHAGAWILTMLYCGLRPQETAALQGRHINLKKMELTIEQAQKTEGNIATTKTEAGKRIIPIPPQLTPYLPEVETFDFVFKSPKGFPLSKKSMNDMWHSFKREMQITAGCRVYRHQLVPSMTLTEHCGHSCLLLYPDYIRNGFGQRDFPIMDDLVPYCYRHTFCTDAVTAGVPIETLKDLAGHKNISVTAKFYIHMTPERMNQAAKLLADYHSANIAAN